MGPWGTKWRERRTLRPLVRAGGKGGDGQGCCPELAELPELTHPQGAEALFPAIEALLAHAQLATDLPDRVPASAWRSAIAICSSVNLLVFIRRSSHAPASRGSGTAASLKTRNPVDSFPGRTACYLWIKRSKLGPLRVSDRHCFLSGLSSYRATTPPDLSSTEGFETG